MRRRWNRVGACLAAVLLMTSGTSRTAARSSQRLFDVTTAHGVADGVPVEPADVFTPEESPIYVWYRCEGCTMGTVISSSWFYLEQEPPVRFAHGSATVRTLEDFGEFHCELGPGRRWPAGSYRIDLHLNDALAAQASFRIAIHTRH
jgi:hypothetical protein